MPDVYRIFNITVERTNIGKYYASICIETEAQPLPKTRKQVGFDLGLIDLLIGSDGTRYERPRFNYANKDKLAKEQRKLSKMRTKLERVNASQWYSKDFRQVDRFYASSKICSECGTYHKDIVNSLSVREWICPDCGTHHDRDVNAARNILIKALSVA